MLRLPSGGNLYSVYADMFLVPDYQLLYQVSTCIVDSTLKLFTGYQ